MNMTEAMKALNLPREEGSEDAPESTEPRPNTATPTSEGDPDPGRVVPKINTTLLHIYHLHILC
jgi:hypothetical protein